MMCSDEVHHLAVEIAESEIKRLGSVALMQCEPDIAMDFPKLFGLIREERQQDLDAVEDTDHPHVLQRFAADAGYLGTRRLHRHQPRDSVLGIVRWWVSMKPKTHDPTQDTPPFIRVLTSEFARILRRS